MYYLITKRALVSALNRLNQYNNRIILLYNGITYANSRQPFPSKLVSPNTNGRYSKLFLQTLNYSTFTNHIRIITCFICSFQTIFHRNTN
jgi:hypothetical protein